MLIKHIDRICANPNERTPIINIFGPQATGKTRLIRALMEHIKPLESLELYVPGQLTYTLENKILVSFEPRGQNLPCVQLLNDLGNLHLNSKNESMKIVQNISHWISESLEPIYSVDIWNIYIQDALEDWGTRGI